ncbi:type I inositol polyphosphate 5-phosphatase 2 [Humulus lupulus]|uniref:type I inositol polyphosphate 5-phosphatase 2 n=1 Tax=Humulus lupulus TaxID=3486 RepID=UPI002B40802D|nr:type I inositol polyphosphate 5-phosphatase 2 [Humulus lupulus]XP_062073713.1 type I inositol polyphosphate 5-phosphatase 2 [Humulus lupulus]XP_062073714.1 type I inositol polyphosphate 5-phosphatase 2 [Humulus lupulus]XP_062073715.1 type I inositol polyphosphate 5-phosphatase 2 [Humulus lupulus]XP_062073716.1 type I inositol polyphosphate 5-phosphatase 2 [Humulus lupulus]
MTTKRGKHSQPFWPSLVMKKWLNIQPKVYEYSEDEVDTETESEDDACSLKDARMHTCESRASRMLWNQPVSTQTSDKSNKSYWSRHKRGKSETLRVQYINTKDVRVTIGTWNVAGIAPSGDLDIDDWLSTEEPSDIYIIGFQEIVPLNAGNVLGAEDNKPIPKWEAIIRRTLNKSFEPEGKHKSYSAPPSPVMRTSSVADVLADDIDAHPLELQTNDFDDGFDMEREEFNKAIGLGKNLQLKRIYGVDDIKLDWPERSLEPTQQVISTNSKLRRVLSSNARIGFNGLENSLMVNQHVPLNGSRLRRSSHSSGNLGLMWMEKEQEPEVLDTVLDLVDLSSEEEDDDMFPDISNDQVGDESVNTVKPRPRYVKLVSKQMVGIYISVWVRKRLRRHINNLKVFPVGTGLMGYMGNKGSVSVSMSLFHSRLCFVCSHLTSGQKEGAEQKRNSDVNEIIRRTRFSPSVFGDQPLTIPSHDQIFWFGDLNYRLNMLDHEVRKLVSLKRWDELLKNDQLTKELRRGHVFEGWKEGAIDFPPTYKYEINTDRYVGENPKEGEKKRSPAWCDRILWLGKGIKQLSYYRSEIRVSDHRPVSSVFAVEVEVLNQRKLKKAINFTSAVVHPAVFSDEERNYEY